MGLRGRLPRFDVRGAERAGAPFRRSRWRFGTQRSGHPRGSRGNAGPRGEVGRLDEGRAVGPPRPPSTSERPVHPALDPKFRKDPVPRDLVSQVMHAGICAVLLQLPDVGSRRRRRSGGEREARGAVAPDGERAGEHRGVVRTRLLRGRLGERPIRERRDREHEPRRARARPGHVLDHADGRPGEGARDRRTARGPARRRRARARVSAFEPDGFEAASDGYVTHWNHYAGADPVVDDPEDWAATLATYQRARPERLAATRRAGGAAAH